MAGVPDDDSQAVVLGRSRVVEVPEPVPLRSAAWAKGFYLVAALLAGPLQIVALLSSVGEYDEASSAASAVVGAGTLLLFIAVIAWTWVNVGNCRRVLAHSRRRSSVSPWRGVFWWLAVAIIGLPLLGGLLFVMDRYADPADGGDAEVVRAFLVVGWLLIVLVLWVRPYLYLANVMRRIHGDHTLFHRWIWMPILTSLVSFLGIMALSFAGIYQSDSTRLGMGVVAFLLALLPYVVWCRAGWKAMSTMDVFARARSTSQHEQRQLYLQTVDNVASARM